MKKTFMALGVILLINACLPLRTGLTDEEISTSRKFYENTPVEEQMRIFGRYAIEDQYSIFIYGNQFRHPPAQYLARCFALNGLTGVDLLRSKLNEQNGDLTVRDIVRLLKEIDAMRMYDVAGDHRLMAIAEHRISAMENRDWKDSAEKLMAKIGHSRETSPGNAPACGNFRRDE